MIRGGERGEIGERAGMKDKEDERSSLMGRRGEWRGEITGEGSQGT